MDRQHMTKADRIRHEAYQRVIRNRRTLKPADAVRMMRQACRRAWDIERSSL